MEQTQFCKMCKLRNTPPRCPGFLIGWGILHECPYDHNTNLITYNISDDDLLIICDISEDPNFIEAMIDLKEKDIIEYESKMTQFKSQIAQQKNVKEDTKPKCPYCNSTDLSKISTSKKIAKIAAFGIFGMGDNGKTWKCNNCGSRF